MQSSHGGRFLQFLNALPILPTTLDKQSVETATVSLQHGMEICSAHSHASAVSVFCTLLGKWHSLFLDSVGDLDLHSQVYYFFFKVGSYTMKTVVFGHALGMH